MLTVTSYVNGHWPQSYENLDMNLGILAALRPFSYEVLYAWRVHSKIVLSFHGIITKSTAELAVAPVKCNHYCRLY